MGIGKSKQQANVVCVGLDFAGKSTIINFLKPENQKVDDLQPTVGLSTESFKYGKIAFTVQDMSGARQYRSLWKENIDSTDGVLFVIDSADSLRLVIAKDELAEIVAVIPRETPFLFFANKKDLPKAMSPNEIAEELRISELCGDRRWNIVATNALDGTGIDDGMKWLSQHLPNLKK